jgi:hypothetical protein
LALSFPEILDEWDYDLNGDPHNYSPFSGDYVGWICRKCGHKWKSTISNRTSHGNGCKICKSSSKGEDAILAWIERNLDSLGDAGFAGYCYQKTFPDCVHKKKLSYDFGFVRSDDSWVLVEYHGGQHFEPFEHFGGKDGLKLRQKRDKIKRDYCEANNIPLIIIPYWEFDNIEEILTEALL